MLKVFAVIILILIVLCVVLFLTIKSQKLKIKQLEIKTEGYKNSYFEHQGVDKYWLKIVV